MTTVSPLGAPGFYISPSSPSFLQRVKEAVNRVWTVTTAILKASFDKVSFMAFRTLEWIHPTMGLRVENLYLRMGNVFRSIKSAWRKETTETELRTQAVKAQHKNVELEIEIGKLRSQNEQLKKSNEFLTGSKVRTDQELSLWLEKQSNLSDREKLVLQFRDALKEENVQLLAQNKKLAEQRDAAVPALCLTFAMNFKLYSHLNQALEEIGNLRSQIRSHQEVATALDQIEGRGDPETDPLNKALLKQLTTAASKLGETCSALPPTSPARANLRSCQRLLGQVAHSFDQVTQLTHRDFDSDNFLTEV